MRCRAYAPPSAAPEDRRVASWPTVATSDAICQTRGPRSCSELWRTRAALPTTSSVTGATRASTSADRAISTTDSSLFSPATTDSRGKAVTPSTSV